MSGLFATLCIASDDCRAIQLGKLICMFLKV